MKIAIVAAEAAPHAKAGGLADVIGSLPGALKAAGEEPSLIVPGYSSIVESVESAPVLRDVPMRFGTAVERFSVLRATDPHGVPFIVVRGRIGGSAMCAAAVNALARAGL